MKNGIPIKIEDYICEDNQIYFLASNPCIIGKFDYQSDSVDILFEYSQTVDIFGAFTRIVKYQQKIYCIPCHAENIYCYNIHSGQFYSLNISNTLFLKMPKRKIIEAIVVNGLIYCVCRSPHFVLIIDPETDVYEIIYNDKITGEHEFFSLQFKDDCLIYPFFHNLIVRFDVKKIEFYIETLYYKDNQDTWKYIFHSLYDDDGFSWVCNFRGEVYRIKNNTIKKLEFPKESVARYRIEDSDIHMIDKMIYIEGRVYFILIAAEGFQMLEYQIADEKFRIIEVGNYQKFIRSGHHYDVCKTSNNMLHIYRYDVGIFYIWKNHKTVFDEFIPLLSGDKAAGLQMNFSRDESDCANIVFYLEYISNFETGKAEAEVENFGKENYGMVIYTANK